MATIVTMEDQNGAVLKRAKIVEHTEIANILPMLISLLSLPVTDDAGRPIKYGLSYHNRRLQDTQTLKEVVVHDGDSLTVVAETLGGSGSSQTTHPTLLPYLETDIRQLLPREAQAQTVQSKLNKIDESDHIYIFVVEDPLTLSNITIIMNTLNTLSVKFWLIAEGHFENLIEYTQTHRNRFVPDTNFIITDITHNSPFNFDISLNPESVAKAMQVAIDSISQAVLRKKEKQLALQDQELTITLREREAKALEDQKMLLHKKEAQDIDLAEKRQLLELEKQKLELEKQELEIEKQKFDIYTSRINYALDTSKRIVDLLYSDGDNATKSLIAQTLLPDLLHLYDTKGLQLAMPTHQMKLEGLRNHMPLESDDNMLIQLIDTVVITVSLSSDRRVTFTIKGGAFNYSSQGSDELNFDSSDLIKEMREMGEQIATIHSLPQDKISCNNWSRQIKREGMYLYLDLLQPVPGLEEMLEVIRNVEGDAATLVFSGPRQYLSLPYELLYYRHSPLIIQFAVCRQVNDINLRDENFDNFFLNLRKRKEVLRILLIASEVSSTTSDEQVLELEVLMRQTIQRQFGFQPVIDKLLTQEASIEAARDCLRNCRYHIVHYAGRGVFEETTGENSGLTFSPRKNMEGEFVTLKTREIASLLASSETRLFYVNAYGGTEVSADQVSYDKDYPSVMDALVQAKVPYVLGFRWHVTDRGARSFASLFYQHLFTRPLIPERAVLHARKRIFEEDPTDETWISPILVAQTPYQ